MLSCSGNIVVTVLQGVTELEVDWSPPMVSDNSGVVNLVSQTSQSGASFPVGTTTSVTYMYADPAGNEASCSFDVTIIEENPCQVNPCLNGGSCVALDLSTTVCVCPRCFNGDVCQLATEACDNNLCGSGSTCVTIPDSCTLYTCECPPCFTGQFCTQNGDVCDANECASGAFCQADPADCTLYVCICPPCFIGTLCDILSNGCLPNPCLNNGVCSDILSECNAYRCDCVGCFSGYNCEAPIPNPCDQSPCFNDGECTRNIEVCASYTCRCLPGYSGTDCELTIQPFVNPCNSFPCSFGASCMSVAGNTEYVCMCRDGFSGINCAMMAVPAADLCLLNNCQNGGLCYTSYDSGSSSLFYQPQYICVCAEGFTGTNCQNNVAAVDPALNLCVLKTEPGCQNGGVCANTFNSFSLETDYICVCNVPYTGKHCERVYVDPCGSTPCQYGGTCQTFQDYFVCTCTDNFMGVFCQTPRSDFLKPVVINCPSNIRLNSEFGELVAAFWTAPMVSDDSGFVDLLFASHMPGSLFPLGDSAVSYVYSDPSDNQESCTFLISVQGPGLPSYIVIGACPGNIFLRTVTGNAVALWADPIVTSSAGTVMSTQTHLSGASFNIGTTTTVSYTYNDNQNNQASCVFTVTVEIDNGIDVSFCPLEVTETTTDPNGQVTATWTVPVGVSRFSTLVITSSHEPGVSQFSVGTTNVVYRFSDNMGNSEICSFSVIVTVEGQGIQIFNCPADIQQPAATGNQLSEFRWSAPIAVDQFNNIIQPTVNRSPPVFLGNNEQLTIVYTFISGTGTDECTFLLSVAQQQADTTPPTVISSPNTIVISLPAGIQSIPTTWVEPVVTDNSGFVMLISQTHFSGVSLFSVGTTRVIYIYADQAGNELQVTFDVVVNQIGGGPDTTPPVVVNVPGNILLTVLPDQPAIVTWVEPSAVDSQGIAILVGRTHAPGSIFPDGATTVTYIFSDMSNFVQASFSVVVLRVTAQPVVTNCPANMEVFVPAGSPGVPVTWVEPSVANLFDSGSIVVEQSHNPGQQFPVGTTPVNYSFNILDVLVLNCFFSVTITEIIPDQIMIRNCPMDIFVELPYNRTFMGVEWTPPTATLNGVQLTPISQPPSNAGFFPLVSFVIEYLFQSGSMSAICNFTITVTENSSLPIMGKRDVADNDGFAVIGTLHSNSICSENTCANGGTCQIFRSGGKSIPYCTCPSGWTGLTCEEYDRTQMLVDDGNFQSTILIAAVALMLVIFIATVTICCISGSKDASNIPVDEKPIIQ